MFCLFNMKNKMLPSALLNQFIVNSLMYIKKNEDVLLFIILFTDVFWSCQINN